LKKMNSFDREADSRKRKEKMYRFLNSRGFPDGIISELLRRYA
jgi:SOS response regulatory protein OraA/RecX